MPPAEIVSLLTGQLPEQEDDSISSEGRSEGGLYRVDQYRASKNLRSVWIDPLGRFLTRLRKYTQWGDIAYECEFAGQIGIGNGLVPQRVTISGDDMSMIVRYTDVVSSDDDESSFLLPVPEGISPVSLD